MLEYKQGDDDATRIFNLEERVRRQAHEIDHMRKVLERKNRELDALHLVWCDGGCPSGVHRWTEGKITEELVQAAERNTKRLRSWYNTAKWRYKGWRPGQGAPTQWHVDYARRAAERTDLLD